MPRRIPAIIIVGGGPNNELPGGQPGIDNTLPGYGNIDNTLPPIEGPVDPGFGYPLPPVINGGPPNYIDIGLPGGGRPSHPIYPTYPVDPNWGLPAPPSVWPNPPIPVYPSHPIPPRPDQGLPGSQPGVDNSLPGSQPGIDNTLPRPPGRPDNSLPPIPVFPNNDLPIFQGGPNNDLPIPPGGVWPPLPPYVDNALPGTKQLMCFVWIPGIGYRWTTIDLNLKPTHPMVPPSTVPVYPDHALPPHIENTPIQPAPQPKK